MSKSTKKAPIMSKRTISEQIEYFNQLAYEYQKSAARTGDEHEAIRCEAKAEAYELAAFELERNMQH